GGVGVSVQGKGSDRGALSLSSSVIERCLEEGVYVSGSDATIAATAIRDVAPESDGSYGRGVDVQSTDGRRATLTMQSSVVERCFDIGVFAQASDVTVASSIVRDMQPRK